MNSVVGRLAPLRAMISHGIPELPRAPGVQAGIQQGGTTALPTPEDPLKSYTYTSYALAPSFLRTAQ